MLLFGLPGDMLPGWKRLMHQPARGQSSSSPWLRPGPVGLMTVLLAFVRRGFGDVSVTFATGVGRPQYFET
jgi:hypothetical protein